ncbi:MAG: DUF6531 domain-containing protein, partial [Rhodanobacteraceae bacterium]
MAGNDVDQANLLVALLRASGAPARYVQGVLDVPAADLAPMIGVREDQVGLALAAAGIANRPLISGGRIKAYALEQVYVSAYLPFANYRGTTADLDGRAWLPLAPAIKPHELVPATGALSALDLDVSGFVEEYLAAPQSLAPLDLLRQQVSNGLAQLQPPQAYADQLSRHEVSAQALELLPASLPVPVEAVTGENAELPSALRQKAHIVIRAGDSDDSEVVFDHVLPLRELIDTRVTLGYAPASIDDGRIADQHGGLGAVPPSLVHVRPVIAVAGQPTVAGQGEMETGASHRIEITLSGPAGSESLAQTVTAGGLTALVFDAQHDQPPEQPEDVSLPGDSETAAARILANFGARYLSEWDRDAAELARLVGVSVVRPFPSVALVINQYRVERVAGVVDAMTWQGVGLDAALRPVEPFPQTSNDNAARNWMQLASLQGSVLEHQLFEQQWSVESVSADKGLAVAASSGIPVLQLTSADEASQLNLPQAVKDNISQWLDRGFEVAAVSSPVPVNAWTGSVWQVRSPDSGEAGYFIAGALAGGATAMPPELWYFQDLAALLANPYAQQPNTDPLAGAVLSIDASAQYQFGVAGTLLAKPLRATVLDKAGRPVQGAAVAFVVGKGTARLVDADGNAMAQAVFLTDRYGIATAQVKLGTTQGTLGLYKIEPGQEYPQWVGTNQVEVSAQGETGVLQSGQAFVAYTMPDAPDGLELVGDADRLLTPGLSYSPYLAKVVDQYGNEVSNVPVSLEVSTQYVTSSCGGTVDAGAVMDASLFEPGQCPGEVTSLTGNACAQAALAVTSRPNGAPFFVVPPATALARVSITGSAAGVIASKTMATSDALFDGCHYSHLYALPLWQYTPVIGYGPLLEEIRTVLDAAPPGQLMPAPQRVDVFETQLSNDSPGEVNWQPIDNATFRPELQNGSLDAYHSMGSGQYLIDLRAGSEPGPVHGQIYASWPNANLEVPLVPGYLQSDKHSNGSQSLSDLVFAWSVDLRAPTVTPARIPLTPYGATDATIEVQSEQVPADYIGAPVQIDILKGDEIIASCASGAADRQHGYCERYRGILVDTEQQYSARMTINGGTPFRMQSPRTPIRFGQGIVAGFGTSEHELTGAASELLLVEGRYPTMLRLLDDVDIPSGYSCTRGAYVAFLLSQDARVSLVFHKLDEQGDPTGIVAWTALDGVQESAGLQQQIVTSQDLPIGDYDFELTATASDGTVETYRGFAAHHARRRDVLPLAHSMVKGVDLYSGGAVLSSSDITIDGRGPSLNLSRTYASNLGDERGVFGRGWSSSLDSQVRSDACGTRVVTGASGQGQRFAPTGIDADGNRHFAALHGYHGILVQKDADYDFYAKDGTHYHFGQFDSSGQRLSWVEDTNGNRLTYNYEINQDSVHVNKLTDSSGRHIDIKYKFRDVQTEQSGITIRSSFYVASEADGPGGLHIKYEYDDQANLVKVTRSDGSSGDRVQGYAYENLGGILGNDPDGNLEYFHFGYRLKSATDLLDSGTRTYAYKLGWSAFDAGEGKVQYIPAQRVESVTEPDGGVTKFAYDGVRGLVPAASDVTDARNNTTHYALNRYGAAVSVTDPAGTSTTVWDMAHLQPESETDALGTTTSYSYDDAGNKTSESIQHATGTINRSWTYAPAGQFAKPYIRNRVATATDGNGNVTSYNYDDRGNRIQTTLGSVAEQDSYAANGDHQSHT